MGIEEEVDKNKIDEKPCLPSECFRDYIKEFIHAVVLRAKQKYNIDLGPDLKHAYRLCMKAAIIAFYSYPKKEFTVKALCDELYEFYGIVDNSHRDWIKIYHPEWVDEKKRKKDLEGLE